MNHEISYKLAFENGKLQEYLNASEVLKKIFEGCKNVIDDQDIHNDAKNLAKFIISDCKKYLLEE
jgi:hypothetical protein